ncbi:MAG: 50S ribosomal protein L7/L12 [Planctomycetota bacterium]|nr:MAG: 50S ribosomal protein L7/L12 [Planctomycetota bacterium]
MATEKVEKILELVGQLNLMELKELIDAYKEKFGVEAVVAAPAGAAAATAAAPKEEAKEEKTTFTVVLQGIGDKKVPVIKAIRQIRPDLGLKEAKEFVESAAKEPKEVKTDVPKEEAEKMKKMLEEAGATVVLK